MEGGARSGGMQGGVMKIRNASGCLVVKKKRAGVSGMGIGIGIGEGALRSGKEKKRRRVAASSDFYGSRDGYDHGEYMRAEDEEENGPRRRRSRLDGFELDDEYDRVDEGYRVRRDWRGDDRQGSDGSGRRFFSPGGAQLTESEAGTSVGGGVGDVVHRRGNSFQGGGSGSSSLNNVWSRGPSQSVSSAYGAYRSDPSVESIRIQGKNGVLKVRVDKAKNSGLLKAYSHCPDAGDIRHLRAGGIAIGNPVAHSSKIPDVRAEEHIAWSNQLGYSSRMPEVKPEEHIVRSNSLAYSSRVLEPRPEEQIVRGNHLGYSSRVLEPRPDEQVGTESFQNLHKSMPAKLVESPDSESDDSATSSKSRRDLDPLKAVDKKKGKEKTTPPSKITPAGSGSKRGNGTEKQKLREHIKKLLLDNGWTIDYRPRRNRDYSDAVYVSTSGTAYWSIVKAYEAFQKEAAKENRIIPSLEESSLSPLPDTILSKLTRKTRKKMEKEAKVKHQKSGGSGVLRQAFAGKSVKAKSESDESASGEDEENEDAKEEEDDEMSSFILKEGGNSLKAGNGVFQNIGSQYHHQRSHNCELVSGDDESCHLLSQGRKNGKLSRCALVVPSTNKGLNTNDSYVPYNGKRTLLSWLIDCGSVELNEKVRYMNRNQKRISQEGWIARDGIHCVCCSKIVSVAKFEIHAGSKLQQPLQNIITESGASLLQCLLEAWNKQAESAQNYFLNVDLDDGDSSDDACSKCGDGGDLICCDGCPSTYHQNCLGLEVRPAGDWHCPYCICIYCGACNDSDVYSDASNSSLLTCNLCEKKYHFSCSIEAGRFPDDTSSSSFCGMKCKELYNILQKSTGLRHDLEPGFSWSLIRRTIVDANNSIQDTLYKVECNAKLAVAQNIMDECFSPIVDRRSQANLIHNILYSCGSNFNRLNYKGFYIAILEKGDEIISAASLRFHGTKFAEMPFIGTRHIYRRQGMCRKLFSAIENALRSFKVEKLIIPAISELLNTWTGVFGFRHLEQSDKEKLRPINMVVLPGVDVLQKVLVEKENSEGQHIVETGLHDTCMIAPDATCQDPGVFLSESPIFTSPMDGRETHLEPVKTHEECMKESRLQDEMGSAHVDYGSVTDDKAVAPDLSAPLDSPHKIDLLGSNDESISSGKMKSESCIESKCSLATDSCIDIKMEERLVSELLVGKDAQSSGNDDKSNLPAYKYAETAVFDCTKAICIDDRSASNPFDDCAKPVGSIDKSPDCSPHSEQRNKSLEVDIPDECQQGVQLSIDEYLVDAAHASQSSIQAEDILSNGNVIMGDVDIQRRPHKETKVLFPTDATTAASAPYPMTMEKDFHDIISHIATPNATSIASLAVDLDVDMIDLSVAASVTPNS